MKGEESMADRKKKEINIPKIKAAADPYLVASALLGPEDMRKAGGKYQIRCMFHPTMAGKEDRNIGNCFLTKTGCYCSTCGSHDVFEMARAVYPDFSFLDSVKFIAGLVGGIDAYTEETEKSRRMPPKEFLQKVGLCLPSDGTDYQIVREMEWTEENLKKPHVRVPDEKEDFDHLYEVTYKKPMSMSLLFYEDPETFKWLVRNKCNEKILSIKAYVRSASAARPQEAERIRAEQQKEIEKIKATYHKYLAC